MRWTEAERDHDMKMALMSKAKQSGHAHAPNWIEKAIKEKDVEMKNGIEEEEQDNIWDTLVDEVMTEVKSTMDPAQGHSETAARAVLVCQSLERVIVARFEIASGVWVSCDGKSPRCSATGRARSA